MQVALLNFVLLFEILAGYTTRDFKLFDIILQLYHEGLAFYTSDS